jgi:two-component system sensor histidine kinase KdpD
LEVETSVREAALLGRTLTDAQHNRLVTPVRLGAEPIAAIALQGRLMADPVLQGISNLVAIGLERWRTQDLASQIEVARKSEQLRTALLDAMAHEFKTPLTSVMAATTSLLSDPDQPRESRLELLSIASEEAKRLQGLIDDAVEMGRLDSEHIEVQTEPANVADIAREVVAGMRPEIDARPIEITCDESAAPIAIDRRLVSLAVKQLVDNALKYSPPNQPVTVNVHDGGGTVTVAVTDHGPGVAPKEQRKIFERLYRSPSVARQVPGSGLGLSIAQNIARAHHGDLTMTSRPGETTFSLTLPAEQKSSGKESRE